MQIFDFNPFEGQAFQGDLVIFAIPGGFSKEEEILPTKNVLTLLEGEESGHHHCISVDSPEVVNSTGQIAALESAYLSKDVPTAKLYRDNNFSSTIVNDPQLVIGFLSIEGAPFIVSHMKDGSPTEEHDGIRLPVGTYYVGRQRELDWIVAD